jgi:hypothetical protein
MIEIFFWLTFTVVNIISISCAIDYSNRNMICILFSTSSLGTQRKGSSAFYGEKLWRAPIITKKQSFNNRGFLNGNLGTR